MTEQSFETLATWQKAHQLMLDIHKKLIPLLPKEEKYGLADQLKRSSKSVPANIAEGSGRYYYMDNVRFCYIARGSLDETLSHLIAARDLEYRPISLYQDLRSQIGDNSATLQVSLHLFLPTSYFSQGAQYGIR